jgi:hypothetical protein
MTSKRISTLFLAAAVSLGSAIAMADSSTGTTHSTHGTTPGALPADKGGATGTGTGSLPNRNTDGSVTTMPNTSNEAVDGPKTPEPTDTKPMNGKTGMGGTGSEGNGSSGAK